jgi:hypothetical protein
LYDYYCLASKEGESISSTIRSPHLPPYIKASVHDIASAFKRFIAMIPGGVIGSLVVFDKLVTIQSQLSGDPEGLRTKQSKLRARLIALVISSVASKHRHHLICAVFGILSLIGRAAKNAPREDAQGLPLPTTDLMDYRALGVVFGPLLIDDLLTSYILKATGPVANSVDYGLSFESIERRKGGNDYRGPESSPPSRDKAHVAIEVAVMLITH